ncbi:MFS transporter [Mangrovitalea sediminis]|uniref:MFS transporter n=1 Tax=Mangrovitalea sediminis TaxID=1982043 RepID=UPI0013046269|nr:MFS transporter [Mangrovitalea sediminis]
MSIDKRQLAVGAAGFCAFTNLYPVQALLPDLMSSFHASAAEVGLTVSAGTAAVALTAPFAGAISDALGRKPIILSCLAAVALVTLSTALATSIDSLIVWRFIVGLFIPGIFATVVAYIGEEWDAKGAIETTGIYVSGTILGGFSGRFIAGIATYYGGWHAAFVALGVMDLILVPLVWRWLPPSKHFHPGRGLRPVLRAMRGHMTNHLLLKTFMVSFGMLFSLVGIFTYVSLRLAGAPFNLGPGVIGGIFVVYLLGVVVTPFGGRFVNRWGRAPVAVGGVVTAILGLCLTLFPYLSTMIVGLALFSAGLFVLQSIATGYVPQVAEGSRSAAVGLYVTAYYIGGTLGGVVPAPIWARYGWGGCVLMIGVVLALIGILAYRLWFRDPHSQHMLAERLAGFAGK